MVVGVGTVELFIPEARSLKDKRSVVRSVVQRVQNQFHISVAEVESLDVLQTATIGFAVVTNDSRLANSILSKVVDAVEGYYLAEVTRSDLEVLHV
ncbi:MAG: DUF503 domain-containing protein [Deltaproteobacteria bacterium]|nr:DUF503 domain-containing protein [Deltaproteobacteria bacterium]